MLELLDITREDILSLDDGLAEYVSQYLLDGQDVSWNDPSLYFQIRDAMHQHGFGSEDRVMSSTPTRYQLWFERWRLKDRPLGVSLKWVTGCHTKYLLVPSTLNRNISRIALWARANYAWLVANYDPEMTCREFVHFQMKYHHGLLRTP